MDFTSSDLVLFVHFIWLVWMVSGVALAMMGFVWPALWGWRVFRTLHLGGLVVTATVPLWSRNGVCPLTNWEWALGRTAVGSGGDPEPLLVRIMAAILYWDVTPWAMSIATAFAALITIVVFVARPPWRVMGPPRRERHGDATR